GRSVVAEERDELVVAGLATETSEPFEHRHERLAGPVLLETLASSSPEPAARGDAFQERFDDRGLPDSWIAGDEDDLALTAKGTRQMALERGQLGIATDDRKTRAPREPTPHAGRPTVIGANGRD